MYIENISMKPSAFRSEPMVTIWRGSSDPDHRTRN